MQKLKPVEEAKTMFAEAREWGMFKWLAEKRRARRTADAAWAALEEAEKKAKARWTAEVRAAFDADKGLHSAERKAHKAHMDAEAQFDEADRRMSTSMACEGAQMAIDAWEMREAYIKKLAAFGKSS